MTLTEIRESRAGKVAEMRALLAKAETEKRNLNDGEKSKFDALKTQITDLEGQEQRAQFVADIERRAHGEPVDKPRAELEARVNIAEVIRCQMEGRSLTGAAAEFAAETERRTGRKAQGVFVPLAALEKRDAQTTTTAAPIVQDDYRPDLFIGPLRNSLIMRRLGARVLTGLRGDLVIPRFGTGLTAAWVAEGEQIPESGMTFDDPVRLTPKHVGAITDLSHGNYSNSVEMARQFVTLSLRRHLVMWEQAISKQLLTPAGRAKYKPEHSVEGLLRGDATNRADFYKSGIEAGWLLPDEARRLENLPTRGDAA